jgi:hypothetical protein
MKKGCLIPLIVFVLIILIVIVVNLLNPLAKSEEQIRADMLKLTPIGTSIDDVREVIERNRRWKFRYYYPDSGYLLVHGRPRRGSSSTGEYVGVKHMEVLIGTSGVTISTRGIRFNVAVSVFYAFDENSNLIGIAVLSDADAGHTWRR